MVSEQGNAQLVCTVTADSRVLGFVVIDSTVGGRSCGGLRMLPDIDEAEMRGLARAMTLKYGFLGLSLGGAKAGLRADPEASPEERQERLLAFGRAIAPLLVSRTYIPGTDMGTTNEDIRRILLDVGLRPLPRDLKDTEFGYYTALTVFIGVQQAARHLEISLPGLRVAIEGYGKVGLPLSNLLDHAKVCVVAVSTSRGALYNPGGLNVAQLNRLAAEYGSHMVDHCTDGQRIERAALLELPVDILCPCARHDSIHADNVARIRARVICAGANNPVTPEAERRLAARGVLCLPDFVTNCGGVLGGTLEFASITRTRIEAFMQQHIASRIADLLSEAARQNVLPREVAVRVALARSEKVRGRVSRLTVGGHLRRTAVNLYRRGWIPAPLMARLSLPHFEKTVR